MKGYHDRLAREQQGRAWLAWHIGALSQHSGRNYPSLASLTGDRGANGPELRTRAQLLGSLRRMRRAGTALTIRKVN